MKNCFQEGFLGRQSWCALVALDGATNTKSLITVSDSIRHVMYNGLRKAHPQGRHLPYDLHNDYHHQDGETGYDARGQDDRQRA